jgi:hypothetical protein
MGRGRAAPDYPERLGAEERVRARSRDYRNRQVLARWIRSPGTAMGPPSIAFSLTI